MPQRTHAYLPSQDTQIRLHVSTRHGSLDRLPNLIEQDLGQCVAWQHTEQEQTPRREKWVREWITEAEHTGKSVLQRYVSKLYSYPTASTY